jgi:hypothetical protein
MIRRTQAYLGFGIAFAAATGYLFRRTPLLALPRVRGSGPLNGS